MKTKEEIDFSCLFFRFDFLLCFLLSLCPVSAAEILVDIGFGEMKINFLNIQRAFSEYYSFLFQVSIHARKARIIKSVVVNVDTVGIDLFVREDH